MITEFTIPTPNSYPTGIAPGPDGALWFSQSLTGKIGRITVDGQITEFAAPRGAIPVGLAAGPDGAMWFTLYQGQAAVGRITMSGEVSTFPLLSSDSAAFYITAGPDNAMWFTDSSTVGAVGRIDMSGTVKTFPLKQTSAVPYQIAASPDGSMWATAYEGGDLLRITPAGEVKVRRLLQVGAGPNGIAPGPDGAMWFVETGNNSISRLDAQGDVTSFRLPSSAAAPVSIAAGPDGAMWFTEFRKSRIGRIAMDGSITEFELPKPESGPLYIAAGADGAMWFTENGNNSIGRITMEGAITEFALPDAKSLPWGIALGPDGAMWFAQYSGNRIGRITVSGQITQFQLPNAGSLPSNVAAGPDGAMWFTERGGNRISRIKMNGDIRSFTRVRFPPDIDAAVERVWTLEPDPREAGVVWAGVEPHSLWRSADAGETFELNRALWDHPHRTHWMAGAGGPAVHNVHRRPDGSTYVAMTGAGVYRSATGTTDWEPANRGISASFMPDPDPEFGQCVHRLAIDGVNPDRMYVQNHGGVFRTDDAGDTWTEISAGLPESEFGFVVLAHPMRSGTLWVIPITAETMLPADGRLRVWKSENAGVTWQPNATGLPDDFFAAVLRDAAHVIPYGDDVAMAFGTRNGSVFMSLDGGTSFSLVASGLPDVLSLRIFPQ